MTLAAPLRLRSFSSLVPMNLSELAHLDKMILAIPKIWEVNQ
jgi:hypothetical protein